ncbi:MAG: metal-dependent hydrolase [Silicimonas sp.]|nr:metal-dependent hydrolase [Silicimonas sp.]
MVEQTLRIASYNIRKARGLDQRRRPERTLQVINELGADVVVLQEADRRLGARPPALPRRMIEAETDFTLVEVSDNGTSLGWHGNAVLMRDASSIAKVTRIDLPGTEPRGAVLVDLEIGGGLSVVAAHLGLLRSDRRRQLGVLAGETASRGPTVIAGDFNEWSHRKGLEPLSDRFATHAPGHSYHASRPVASLDRFALSHGVELRDAGVEQGDIARRASDHLPVWSDISVPDAGVTC